jgi:uncharacterized hydrophobic protein (TIGR00271 family)
MEMSAVDVQRIERTLFFEQPEMRGRLIRYIMLILFASVIATGGLISDSVASVIGAMIVAPLMTPIMGMVVAIVIGSSSRLGRSALIVASGIAVAIAVGWLMSKLMPLGWVPTSSSQVMARTSPRLIDLVIALASGGAGAYALSRVDVADALPGVAIAISLVPPLNTVGILLAGGEGRLALGATVLFLTNFAAILLAGTVTFFLTGLARTVGRGPREIRNAFIATVALVLLITLPLRANSHQIWQDATREDEVRQIVESWLPAEDWELYSVNVEGDEVQVAVGGQGELPPPDGAITAINDLFDGRMLLTARIVNVRTEVVSGTPTSGL